MVGVLQVLPAGFALPPLPYLVGLLLGTLIVGVLLAVLQPPLRGWDVLALGVWMVVGAALHALYQIDVFPSSVKPLFGTPAVYFTTFIVAGAVWLIAGFLTAAGLFESNSRIVGSIGTAVALVFVGFTVWFGINSGTLEPLWPVVGLVVSVVLAALAFIALSLTYTETVAVTGKVGAFVVFAHTLDAVTTAIGVDVLGVGERSPLPRLIMRVAATIRVQLVELGAPVQFIGRGWLFVVVKVLLALIILVAFTDYAEERPDQANLVLTLVTAVGFGPGVQNLLLFLVGGVG